MTTASCLIYTNPGPLLQLQQIKKLGHIRAHRIGEVEITGGIKRVGDDGCPLAEWQRQVGGGEDGIILAWPAVGAAKNEVRSGELDGIEDRHIRNLTGRKRCNPIADDQNVLCVSQI